MTHRAPDSFPDPASTGHPPADSTSTLDASAMFMLIKQASRGDRIAFQRLILRNWSRLERRIGRRIPPELKGRLSAEDVLQDALIDVAAAICTFDPVSLGSFYRWLFKIVDHRMLDVFKFHKAIKRGGGTRQVSSPQDHATSSVDDLIALIADAPATASRAYARDEALGALHSGMSALTEEYRTALQLRYIECLPVREVATRMNTTDAAVHNLCYRGVRQLRTLMGRTSQFFST